MGKVLKVFGIIFLGVIVLFGGVFIYGMLVGPKLDLESKAYVDNTIPILVNDWNPEELKSRATNELLQFLKEPDISNLYGMFKKLGRMTQYTGSKGQSGTFLNLPKGILTTAAYVASADFENGQAKIKMSLIKRNGSWQINEFRVDSPSFLQK